MGNSVCKVLQITSYPPPLTGWGMRVRVLKQEMERRGHICTVLNIGKGRFLQGRDFVPVHSGLDYVKKVLRYRLRGYLVHMHLNGDSPKGFVLALLAVTVSLLTFRRPVLTFHAGPVQKYFPQSQAPLLTPMFKFIFGAARAIICNSDAEKQAIMGYGIPGEKIVPIQAFTRQYLDFEPVPLPEPVERFFAAYPEAFCTYLLYRPQYFLSETMQALARLFAARPKAGLVLMGPGEDEEQVKALLQEYGIAERVLLLGNQPHDVFLTVFRRSKLYLRTHWKDGVSSSVLEALALGVPVVACENGRRPPSTVTFENQNVDDLIAKLEFVLEHHQEVAASIIRPELPDTIEDEIAVLVAA